MDGRDLRCQRDKALTGCEAAQGMGLLRDYDYIAIFDADFKPDPDFLARLALPPAKIAVAKPALTLSGSRLVRAELYDDSLLVLVQVTLVPYLIDNLGVGYVQARWAFTNPEESYLTKVGQ